MGAPLKTSSRLDGFFPEVPTIFSEFNPTALSAARSISVLLLDWCAIFALISLPILLGAHFWIYAVSFIMVARFQRAIAILGHDGVHARLCNSFHLNDCISQYFLGGPLLTSFFNYRRHHVMHHRFTQTAMDPDHIPDFPANNPGLTLFRWFTSDLLGLTFAYWVFVNLRAHFKGRPPMGLVKYQKTHVAISIVLSQAALLGYCDLLGDVKLYFFLWLLPLFTVSQLFSRIRGLSEHAGLPKGDSVTEHTRNVIHPIENFFLAPHNAKYHIEHHLNPKVPFYNLPRYSQLCRLEHKLVQTSYISVLKSFLN